MIIVHDHGSGVHRDGSHLRPDFAVSARTDRRWLFAAFGLIVTFMAGEVVAGLVANSLALLSDAAHMLTDAAALLAAVIASRIAQRPARGAYTYGFRRVDALAGQLNGITLLLLAIWFLVEAARRLAQPPRVDGALMVIVGIIGVVVNVAATLLVRQANQQSLNIRGALAHLLADLWAFTGTMIAGIVILVWDWRRADAIATILVAVLMIITGWHLVRAAGRVFLDAAPSGLDPQQIGQELAAQSCVSQVHDLHVWDLGAGEPAMSAHVLVDPQGDCHAVGDRLRELLRHRHGIDHVTLQVDHASLVGDDGHCAEAHGPIHGAGTP